jgi:F0F1-type ATP synthase assembly protein I
MDDLQKSTDDRAPFARAIGLAYGVIGVCLQLVAPVVGGYWLDRLLGTGVLFTIIGLALGMGMGFWGLMRMVESLRPSGKPPSETNTKRRL